MFSRRVFDFEVTMEKARKLLQGKSKGESVKWDLFITFKLTSTHHLLSFHFRCSTQRYG
jgi:hypothetical protein